MKAEEVKDLLVKEWTETKNVNCFLVYVFMNQYSNFLSLNVTRSGPSKEFFNLKKPLFERLVNKVMNTGKKNGGKKLKCEKMVLKTLESYAKKLNYRVEELLLLAFVKSVPNYGIRRLKYGSGFLTKIVHLTFARKIVWFLKTFINASKKRNKSFASAVNDELDLLFNKSTKSMLVSAKRESEISALKANLV